MNIITSMKFFLFSLSVLFTSPCCITLGSDKIVIWANAFIPENIEGTTTRLTKGTHTGKTVIRGPVETVNDCFLTDQRSFSTSQSASSRLHVELIIEVSDGIPNWNSKTQIGQTIEVDCEDGDIECQKTASSKEVKWTLKKIEGTTAFFGLNAEVSNPCFSGSPDIDVIGELAIDFNKKKAEFSGKVDKFPAFEMYAKVNGKATKTLFKKTISKGCSPVNMFGPASEKVQGCFDW